MVVAKYIKKGCVVAGTFLAGLTCSSLPGLFFFFFGGEPKLSFPPFFGPLFLINVLVKPAMLVILLAAPFDRSKSFFFRKFRKATQKERKRAEEREFSSPSRQKKAVPAQDSTQPSQRHVYVRRVYYCSIARTGLPPPVIA